MKVSKLMSQDIVSVTMDDTLSKVKQLFEQTAFHHLLVIGDNKLMGVISDRDLLKSISPKIDTAAETAKDLATLNKKVHQIMAHSPISLNENASITEAVDIFNHNKISCIPVLNDSNAPVGILSWRDIMQALGRRK